LATVFSTSGENSDNIVVPAPQLQGLFVPGIDNSLATDGFGIVTPWGGGSTTRRYGDYGISGDVSSQNTQLYDLASSLIPAGGNGINYNLEGFVGPQGPPGPSGPQGIPGIMGITSLPSGYVLPINTNYLAELPHNIDQINDLGTSKNQLIYTDNYVTYIGDFSWTERAPGGDAYVVDLSYTTANSTKQGAQATTRSWYQSFIPTSTFTLTGLEININSIPSGTARAFIYFYNADVDGKPTGAALGGGSLGLMATTETGWEGNVALSGAITLTSGNRYCFRLGGVVTSGEYHFNFDSNDSYSDGTCYYWNGSAYVAQNGDINFKLYGNTEVGATDKDWKCVASDADGSHLIVAIEGGRLYTSANSGVDWTERQPTGSSGIDWIHVVSDSDGSHLMASITFKRLYTSSNYGVSWTERQPAGDADKDWRGIASDADGSHLVAGTNKRLYTSSNYGVSWTERQPAGDADKEWGYANSDSDGSHLMAASSYGRLYTSADYGVSWTERQPAGDADKSWKVIASDADGSHLVAGTTERLYISNDFGVTWTETQPMGNEDVNWEDLASDSDGSNLITIISGSRCYTGAGDVLYSETTWAETALTSAGRALLDDDNAVAQATTLGLGTEDSPTWTGATLSGLTASRLVASDASKAIESVTVGTGLDYTRPNLTLSHLGIEALADPDADKILFWDDSETACKWLGVGNSVAITDTTIDTIQDMRTSASPQFAGIELGHVSDTTFTRVSAGVVAIQGTNIAMVGGAHHDGFSDFVANEHIDHTSVTLTAGTGLTGGGDISSNRTFAVDGVLEDLDTLGAAASDGQFIVATGEGIFAYESTTTARTSLGVGEADTPTFNQVTLGVDPTNTDHSVTKSYADALVAGAFWEDVTVGTVANVDLSTDLEAGDTIDDYTLVEGDRVLVKEQTDQTENGLYLSLIHI